MWLLAGREGCKESGLRIISAASNAYLNLIHSAWRLVPMVRVDSVLPALQGPNKDSLQGLCLPCPPEWGCPVP